MRDVLSSFIAGSSAPVLLPFLHAVSKIPKSYTFESYSMIAPLYFGVTSALATMFVKNYALSLLRSLLFVSVVSALFVFSVARFMGAYEYTTKEWLAYFLRLIVRHAVAYLTVYAIVKYIFAIDMR